MKYRLIYALLVFVLIVAGAAYVNAPLEEGSDAAIMGVIIVPLTIALIPPILLPRKAALLWCGVIISLVVVVGVLAAVNLQQCSGDSCIMPFIMFIMIIGPVGITSAFLVLIRFLAKPSVVEQNKP